MNDIFLVGPGSVGKSSVAPIVAELTGVAYADLDQSFHETIGSVSEYIDRHGYRAYAEANAQLAAAIVDGSPDGIIIATTSGFLVHDGCGDVVERNLALIRRAGTSLLLLPSEDLDRAAHTLAFRQLTHYPERDLVAEYTILHDRCGRYLAAADHVVITDDDPRATALAIVHEVAARELTGSAAVEARR